MSDGGGFIWFWYGDDGEWKIFTDDQQDIIERARIQGEDQVNFHRGPTTYSLDLVNRFQTNLNTNHQRPISAARANTVWFWRDDNGEWQCYDREDAEKLSRAEAGREDSVILMIGQTPYYVDLARRTQKNVFTEFSRDICQGKPPRPHGDQADDEEEEEDEEMAKAAPESFTCPVSLKLMRDPVTNSVGSTYDRKAIEWWWQNHDTDPLTMETISDKYLVPNRALKDAIDQWKKEFTGAKKPSGINRISSINSANSAQSATARHSTGPSSLWALPSAQVQRSISAPNGPAGLSSSARVSFHGPQSTTYAATSTRVLSYDNSLGAASLAPMDENTLPEPDLRDEFYDTLKVVLLGNNKMGATSIARKLVRGRNATIPDTDDQDVIPPGVDILDWDPLNVAGHDRVSGATSNRLVKFSVWDFAGRDSFRGFRSLFFTSKAFFIIVWDMGVSNPAVSRKRENDTKADDALAHDIYEKVLFWVDCIQDRVPDAVIMPVASFCDYFNHDKKATTVGDMGEKEAKRRCKVLRSKLLLHKRKKYSQSTFIMCDGDDPIMRVSGYSTTGLDVLKEKIVAVGNDLTRFPHIGSLIPKVHLKLRNALRSMKENGCKGIDAARLRDVVNDEREVFLALNWLSRAGELLYFGSSRELEKVSHCVILDIQWFVELAGCMLRHNLKVVVKDTRRLKRKNSRGASPDIDTPYFDGAHFICPLISSGDLYMLWQRCEGNFERNTPAATSQGLSTLKLYKFLQTLLVHFGVIIPVNEDVGPFSFENICAGPPDRKYMTDTTNAANGSPPMYFLPGLLDKGDHGEDLDFYKNADTSMITLAQSVQFFSRVPAGLMERVTVAVLKQINTLHNNHQQGGQQPSSITVKSFQCWRSIFFLKVRLTTSNGSGGVIENHVVETCAQLVDRNSRRCIGADHADDRVKACLIISAKGPSAGCGRNIWNGGYGLVSETAQAVIAARQRLHFEFRGFCTECLARIDLARAQSWTAEKIKSATKKKEPSKLKCDNGHKVDLFFLSGIGKIPGPPGMVSVSSGHIPDAKASMRLKQSVVLVGLYDDRKRSNKICKLGSGFVVDSERGLIVTASRNVLRITSEEKFGADYDGIEGAKIVIGVIPDSSINKEEPMAVFRYYASICAKDPALANGFCHVDACVLEITARFECDVGGNGDACGEEIDIPLRGRLHLIQQQGLQAVELEDHASLEEPVRILGYEQQQQQQQKSDSDSEKGSTSVHRTLGIVAGYVCQQKADSSEDQDSDKHQYRPKRTTVLMCTAKSGMLGGPCINRNGKVIGILSCADPNENTRSFVVPTSEWKSLLPTAPPQQQGSHQALTRQSTWIGSVFRSFSSPNP